MRGISKLKRKVLIFITTLCVVCCALGATLLIEDSVLRLNNNNGYYEYFMPFYERNATSFEDSGIFDDLLQQDIGEITRYCVIRNQLETNGVYDGKKKIDIVKYANRYDPYMSANMTVEYYLDDLINWGNKGIDTRDVSANMLPFESDFASVNIIYPKYKTVDGKDLAFYAEDINEYYMLCDCLVEATDSLSSNYSEYVALGKKLSEKATNIRYCYQIANNGTVSRFTNLDSIDKKMTIDDITSVFTSYRKYIFYNPDKMTISTNTKVDSKAMNTNITKYAYTFGDNSRIWIGFDESYFASDEYFYSKNYYEEKAMMNTYGMGLVIAMLSLAVVYVVLLIILTRKEGYVLVEKVDEENPENKSKETEFVLRKCDEIPTEAYIVFAVCMVFAFMGILYGVAYGIFRVAWGTVLIYPIAIIGAILLNMIFLGTYLAFVRRIKAKSIWKNSCLHYLVKKIKTTSVDAYDNGHSVIRTWVPYIIFLLLNLVFVLCGVAGILFAFIVDMVIGAFLYKGNKERQIIVKGINEISEGDVKHQINTDGFHGDNLELATAVNNIGKGIRKAVETSMKDEKMKADLITNVSHDIKTPLTSIISYVDLLKRENIQDEKICGYIDILDQKSQRLKQLTDDLVEASKISSGNIVLTYENINFVELINQSVAEFADKFEEHSLIPMVNLPQEKVMIKADSRSMFRIIENLYNNIYKYALTGTRVYIDMDKFEEYDKEKVRLSVKNISDKQLNVSAEELLERFKQGDESRKTEGSGLGLSIAKSLTETMGGEFDISLDGDLFKIIISFDTIKV